MSFAGMIQLWVLDTIPDGFLVCDGAEVSQSTYAELYAAIGDIYGAASAGMFKLPDLRGYFARSFTGVVTVDPESSSRTARGDGAVGNVVATTQGTLVLSHTHTWRSFSGGGTAVTLNQTGWSTAAALAPSSAATGGVESRPKNIYITPIVKY